MGRVPIVVLVAVLLVVFACSISSAQYGFGQEKKKENKGRVGYYNPTEGGAGGAIAFGVDFESGRDLQVGVTYAETDVAGANVTIFPIVDLTYLSRQEADYWGFEQPTQKPYYGAGITWLRVGGGVDSSAFGYHFLVGTELKGGKYLAELRFSAVDVNGFDAGGLQLYGGMRF